MLDLNRIRKQAFIDKSMRYIFFICSIFSIFVVFAICLFIFSSSIPAFKEIGVLNFVFGTTWMPSNNKFGILPMIIGSIYVTILATILGGGIGFFTSVYLAMFAPKKIKFFLTQIVSLLAGIPSIVYGFFGMIVLVPILKNISPNGSGEGLLACSIILGVMILPTVASICKSSLEAVPKAYYDGAVALGSTHKQAVFSVVVPAAKSGILAALALGIGRAIGETMAVIMIAGNAPFIPDSVFSFFRTLTINVALEMGYATGIHRSALVATGFVLLVFILILNLILAILKKQSNSEKKTIRKILPTHIENFSFSNIKMKSKVLFTDILKIIAILCTSLSIAALLFIVIFILVKGVPNINMNLLFGKSGNAQMTLFPAIVSTGMLLILSLSITVPIGIFAAIHIVEYGKSNNKLIPVIRLFTESLSGIPSIIFGLFGMILFADILGLGRSLLSGSLTLVIIILPSIVRQSEETLLSIPNSLREGSLALGASKVRTIFKVVLPCGFSGIMTSVVLSVGRIVGESAALIYTAGAVSYMPIGYLSPGSSFSVMMWIFAGEGLYINQAFATAAVLLIIVLMLNFILFMIDKKFKKDY